MTDWIDFTADLAEGETVTLRHADRGAGAASMRLLIGNIYRALWHDWPTGFIAEGNHLDLPSTDQLMAAAKVTDSHIREALLQWCENYPDTDDAEVLEIAANLGEGVPPSPEEYRHLAEVFLEAHDAR